MVCQLAPSNAPRFLEVVIRWFGHGVRYDPDYMLLYNRLCLPATNRRVDARAGHYNLARKHAAGDCAHGPRRSWQILAARFRLDG